jgi:hypothetical protein
MADTSLDLDQAATVSSGPIAGFVQWNAKGSGNGLIQPETFSVRSRDTTGPFDLSAGFLADWIGSQTGWARRDENFRVVERVWNPQRNRPLPRPPGAGWKRSMRIALLIGDSRYLWEQDSQGAMRGLHQILGLMRQAGSWREDEVPRLAHTGSLPDLENMTVVPVFTLLGRAPRRDVFDTPLPEPPTPKAKANGTGSQSEPPPHAPGWDAPRRDARRGGGALVDDDIPF